MKKLITLCLFVMTLFLGTQNSFAQEEVYITMKEDAKELAMKIKKEVGLDDKQTMVVARAIYGQQKVKLDMANNPGEYANSSEAQAQNQNNLVNSLSKVLNDQELEQVLVLIKKAK